MRLLFLTTSYPRHSKDEASIFVARLAEALVPKVEAVTAVVPRDVNELKLETLRGVKVKRFPYRLGRGPGLAFGAGLLPNLRNRPWQFWQLVPMVFGFIAQSLASRSKDTRVVANWILAGIAAAIIKLLSGMSFIYIVRGAEANFARTFLGRWIFGLVINQSSKTICVSQFLAKQLQSIFPKHSSKITYILNGVTAIDQKLSEFSSNIKNLQPYLISVGTVIPRKNLGASIELLATLADKTLRLLIIGRIKDKNYLSQLKELAKKLKIDDRVIFLGEVEPDEALSYIEGSKAFISTSKFEGMPNALLEAMALKKLVIASAIEAHGEVIKAGLNGLLLENSDLASNGQRVNELLNDSKRMMEMGLTAYETVKNRTWDNCATSYLKIITQL